MPSPSALQRLLQIFAGRHTVLESLWQLFPDNVFVVRCEPDGDFIIEVINPAQEKVLGLSAHQLCGCSIRNVVPAPYLNSVISRYRECIQRREPIRYEEQGNGPGLPPRYWQTQLVPVMGADAGRVEYLIGVSRDITLEVEGRQALQQQNNDLEQREQERLAALAEAEQRLDQLAARDELTGLYTRLHFLELAERDFSLSMRNCRPMSLMLIDIDHFAKLNQRLGPTAGDFLLEQLAVICNRSLRATDIIGRYGGEEFIALLSDTDAARVQAIAWRLNLEVANTVFNWQDSHFNITLSMGLAHFNPAIDATLPALVERAEKALLAAKGAGRNRLEISLAGS